MFSFNRWQTGTAVLMVLGTTAGTIAPLTITAPSLAQVNFSDVQSDYWATQFIQQLSQRGIIAGFPDGTFHPEDPVTRAQFAAMINKAFQKPALRQQVKFKDVPNNYWAYNAIEQAYTIGFLSGYPGNIFRPNENIPRQQVLVSLANGLNYAPTGNADTVLQQYNDASGIASYARTPIAAATEKQIVVDYPDLKTLNPTVNATRAQVAAFIYQALVSSNQATAINSPYIVGYQAQPTSVTVPKETVIPVKYDRAKKILVAQNETVPLTLIVAQNVVTQEGTVVIPAGSKVSGELRPAKGGSRFVAQKLTLSSGESYDIDASSEVITKTETIHQGINTRGVIRDSVLGAGAGAAIAGVTGDDTITAGKVLAGAGVGALAGVFFDKKSVKLIAIEPNTDLQLTVHQDLPISLK
jgi:hypothetical protein